MSVIISSVALIFSIISFVMVMRHVQIEKGDKEHTDKNRELIIEMINFIEKYYSGRITDCGGDITEECNEYNCKQFYTCKRNYELTDRIEGIKNKAGRGE